MSEECYDVAVIGGGINGCGIARDAAGRGLSVLLVEQYDLAAGTSSASTKLIHGGLRYLEHFAFRMVRESLAERKTLMRIAPHIVRPMRFILPHVRGGRPVWLMRCGLFLYDLLGGDMPRSKMLNLKNTPAGKSLAGIKPEIGFEYSDCWTDDARLVIINAVDAKRRGARILTRTRCTKAQADSDGWQLMLHSEHDKATVLRARCLINAAGPWAGKFLHDKAGMSGNSKLRLVQGSHIILPKLFDGEHAYILPNSDRRMIFAIPYADNFTLIGTTDRDFEGAPEQASADEKETDYLLAAVRCFFGESVAADNIVHRFCGVRPLNEDAGITAQEASRDYLLQLNYVEKQPILNIFGGKLTTYRKLAQNAVNKLSHAGIISTPQENGDGWTAKAVLPGGNLPPEGTAAIVHDLKKATPAMQDSHALRLAHSYGSEAKNILPAGNTPAASQEDAEHLPGWGKCFGADLYAREVDYLIHSEWAQTAEDVLWRRSQLGLTFSSSATAGLESYMREQRAMQ